MAPNRTPRISVVIPAFNAEAYVGQAIDSVLAQEYEPLEVIVVDDGSTDGTAGVVRRYGRIRCEHQHNQGIGAARNLGIDLATGDLFAFLDADDLWAEGKLAAQVEAFRRTPELDMVFGQVEVFDERSADAAAARPNAPQPGYLAGAMLIRRAAFSRVGRFSSDWHLGEFIDWYMRAVDAGLKSEMLPRVVLRRRIHTDNIGIRERDRRADYARVLKASLDRRRKQRG